MLTDYFIVQLRQSMRVALPLDSTAEVMTLTAGEICPIPGTLPAVLGVVNQRGRLLWVLELSDLLGLAPAPRRLHSQNQLTLVVITSSSGYSAGEQLKPQLGCVVTTLQGIETLNPDEFSSATTAFSAINSSFLFSMAKIKQMPIAVLNINTVFAAISQTAISFSLS